jgi:hypothetical protein
VRGGHVAQRIALADADTQLAAPNRGEELAGSPLEIGAIGNVIEQRRARE